MNRCIVLVVLLAATFSTTNVHATHLRCGWIRINQIAGVGSRTVTITLFVYTNTNNTSVLVGGEGDFLDFGDGSKATVPEIGPGHSNYFVKDPAMGVALVVFSVNHTYDQLGSYVVSYVEGNRSEGILNFNNSVNTTFYLESMFTLAPDREYFSPQFFTEPFFKNPIGPYALSLAAGDMNEYSLIYSLTVPKRDKNARVDGYSFPGDVKINPFNGLITWDGSFHDQHPVGEYLFTGRVSQFDGNVLMGYVVRDVQVIVEEKPFQIEIDDNLDADENNRIYLAPGTTKTVKVFVPHAPGDEVILFAYSDLGGNLAFETYDSLNGTLKVGAWTPTLSLDHERDQPYIITVRALKKHTLGTCYRDINYTLYTRDIEPELPVLAEEPKAEVAIQLSPNPTTGMLNVSGSSLRNVIFKLINLAGQTIREFTVDEAQINIQSVPPGIYLAELWQNAKVIASQRVVKE